MIYTLTIGRGQGTYNLLYGDAFAKREIPSLSVPLTADDSDNANEDGRLLELPELTDCLTITNSINQIRSDLHEFVEQAKDNLVNRLIPEKKAYGEYQQFLWAAKDNGKTNWGRINRTKFRPRGKGINSRNYGPILNAIGTKYSFKTMPVEFYAAQGDKLLSFRTDRTYQGSTIVYPEYNQVDLAAIISVEISSGNKFGSWSYDKNFETLFYHSNQNKILGFVTKLA
jgi:hypothetical protein